VYAFACVPRGHIRAQISVLNGFLLEMCAMMVCRYVELITAEHKRQWLILAVLASTMTALLIDYTGMYYHPISASACLLGCAGTNVIDHFKVYWLGPLFGWYCAELVYAIKIEPPPLPKSYN
jgi:hypothetical protein